MQNSNAFGVCFRHSWVVLQPLLSIGKVNRIPTLFLLFAEPAGDKNLLSLQNQKGQQSYKNTLAPSFEAKAWANATLDCCWIPKYILLRRGHESIAARKQLELIVDLLEWKAM